MRQNDATWMIFMKIDGPPRGAYPRGTGTLRLINVDKWLGAVRKRYIQFNVYQIILWVIEFPDFPIWFEIYLRDDKMIPKNKPQHIGN